MQQIKQQRKKIKRRLGGSDQTEIESEWSTDEIRNVIKEIRTVRKLERKTKEETVRIKLVEKRENLKIVKHRLIKEAKTNHEMKIKEEIENSDNKIKKMWEYMNKMRQKGTTEKGYEIYEDGKKMEDKLEIEKFFELWMNIYQKDPKEIDIAWNKEIKTQTEEAYERELNGKEIEGRNEIIPMKATKMNSQDLVRRIKKLKNNKSPGPDGSRGEYFKELIKK